jgi:hypothetical protein
LAIRTHDSNRVQALTPAAAAVRCRGREPTGTLADPLPPGPDWHESTGQTRPRANHGGGATNFQKCKAPR